jgi:hypothetical protein
LNQPNYFKPSSKTSRHHLCKISYRRSLLVTPLPAARGATFQLYSGRNRPEITNAS